MASEEAILSIRNLVVNYGAIRALKSVSLDVYPGEIVAVIGANGAGKSTMMNAIMGAVERSEGTIYFNGTPLSKKAMKL